MTMNKLVVLALVGVCGVASVSADEDPEYPPKPEWMSENEYDFYCDQGGWWEAKDGYGLIQIVNLQERVSAKEFDRVIASIQRDVNVHFSIVEKPLTNAQVTIELIDDPAAKSIVVYPDESKVVANVAWLLKDSPKQELLNARVRKTLMRAFGYVGGATGGNEGNVLDVMTDLKRLDAVPEQLPGDYVLRCDMFLARVGIKKYFRIPYRVACQQGKANQPTNEFQKVVWDEIHQKPTKGLKIKYDPKKGE